MQPLNKRAIWHIWQPMWSSQGSVLQSCNVLWRGCVIFLRGCDLCVWRGCVIVLTQSFRCMINFSGGCVVFIFAERLRDFSAVIFLWKGCMIFLWRGCMFFFGGQVAWFQLLRGCMILCVDRLCDFFSLTHSGSMIVFSEVVWFFLRRDCLIFVVERLREFC